MAQEIVLFHSALGLRPAVLEFAGRLRAAGHIVHTPDSFDGETFDTIEEGTKKRDALGIPELLKRARAAVENLPERIVYAGFSMGASAAEFLAATRAGAKAAILMNGALAPAKAGIEAWPRGVPVQIHYAKDDRLVDTSEVNALAATIREAGSRVDVFGYQRGGHLFADEALSDYNREAAWLMMERVLEFLAKIDFGERPTAETPVADRDKARPRVTEREEGGIRMGEGGEPGIRLTDPGTE